VLRAGVMAAAALSLLGMLLAVGWVVAEGHVKWLALLAGAGVLCYLALAQRGAFIGVLVLSAMNGIPFVDTSPYVAPRITIGDASVFVLLLYSVGTMLAGGMDRRSGRQGRLLGCAGALLLIWWAWITTRTDMDGHGSLIRAASFGRDFAFFGLLLVVLPRVRLATRDVGALLGVLAAGVCVFALGQIAIGVGAGQLGSLIHFQFTLADSGLTRVYATMTDLVTAGLAASIAACLLARSNRVRLIATAVALLLATSTVVQLTRARWIGIVVGVLLVSLWLIVNGSPRLSKTLRRRLIATIGIACLAVLVVLLADPGLFASGTVADRLLSAFTDLQKGSGTVAIRESVTKVMTKYLGESWLTGLGFVSPSAHFYFGLPEGSIRDTDLGVLNAVMTMGVVGAALVYLPVIGTLFYTLGRASARGREVRYEWLSYGGAIWIIATLTSSATLVTLFSPSGLVLSGLFLTVLAHPSVTGARVHRVQEGASSVSAELQPIAVEPREQLLSASR
jgi:hypothetical protein